MLYVRPEIVTDTSSVVLRGLPSEASGETLSGRVLIRLGYPLKVRRVTIVFQSSDSRKQQHRRQNTIKSNTAMEQNIFNAADNQAGYDVWPATYRSNAKELPFLFTIPGNTHESVRTAFGNIAYELKVTIHTCGFGINSWTRTQRIPVYRVPLEGSGWALSLTDSMCVQADWLGAVTLQMVGDCAAFADNSMLCARAIVRPMKKGQMLADVGMRLREKVCCKDLVDRFGDLRSSQHTVCEQMQKVYNPSDSLQMMALDHEQCFDLALDIPSAVASRIQYSMDTASICVTHELTLVATIVDPHKNAHLLRISAPVRIVPKTALEASFAELPEYSKSCFDRLLLVSSPRALELEHLDHNGDSGTSWCSPPPHVYYYDDDDDNDGVSDNTSMSAVPPSYQPVFGGRGMLVA
ncbi:hypothetical protein EV177_005806 [Coemansia sp. RSA 1804]|nr:hypothetical protein EV177_005806 [Coemansia sp. RSA 1804]